MNRDSFDESMRRNAQLEAIVTNAVDAIITIDDRGIVESVNPATVTMFGYDADEIVGQNVKLLMPPPYHEEHDSYIGNYLRTRAPKIIGIGREVVGRRKDGTTFPIHLAVSEIHVGDHCLFTGIIRDISDLKEAERQLAGLNEELELRVRRRTAQLKDAQDELLKREKLAMLGQVSGGIAHEIRNPLHAVRTSAFYLKHAKSPTQEKTQEHLDRIDRQVTLIDNVITAMSDVAKLGDAELRPTSIVDCIREVVDATSFPDNVEVIQLLDDSLPLVLADQHQIVIAFQNLMRNARDAMPHGGKLTVSATAADTRLAISFRDEGVGIPADRIGRISEPFYSTKARGMGFGLAITRAIIDKNQGLLEVSSEVDIGSNFVVILLVAK